MQINARNVNDAYVEGLWWLRTAGKTEQSRNGPVLVSPEPVVTMYAQPCERVLFNATRNINPFFHLFECIWMMAGSDSVEYVAQYNKRMREYSDDGKTLTGAYGFRWRNHFGFDQLEEVIKQLQKDPHSRRVVLTMWDPNDLILSGKDVPCNTHIYFRVDQRTEQLDLTVCCRSNDVIWGAYGTNSVHFSFLLEFIAGAAGLRVGRLYQFSNNFHIYKELPLTAQIMPRPPVLDINPYVHFNVVPLGVTRENWPSILAEYEVMVAGGSEPSTNSFNELVLRPMNKLWSAHRAGTLTLQQVERETINGLDWHEGVKGWLSRHDRYNAGSPADRQDPSGGQTLQRGGGGDAALEHSSGPQAGLLPGSDHQVRDAVEAQGRDTGPGKGAAFPE